MSEDNDFNNLVCCNCGIQFGYPKRIEKLWREEGSKTFYCPNGHSLCWKKNPNNEANSLKEKLAAANKELEDNKKKIEELATELEIWKPSQSE